MKSILSILTVFFLLSAAVVRGAEPAKDITGSWHGVLTAGQLKLRVVFHIAQSTNGELTATMDSLDQGARGIPMNRVILTGDSLSIEAITIHGLYKGTLDAAGNAISGQWSQGPNNLPLNLVKGTAADTAPDTESLSPADLAASKEAAKKILGTWNGLLAPDTASLRLRINLTRAADGTATGTMDSLDQGANGLPLSAVTLKNGKVRFEVRGVGGVYEGALTADGATLNGQWQQNGNTLPLDFQKTKTQ
ncbi:MAG TPA: hypothetical protein VGM64_06515 [Lacunisphaera sp.]